MVRQSTIVVSRVGFTYSGNVTDPRTDVSNYTHCVSIKGLSATTFAILNLNAQAVIQFMAV